MAQTVIRTAESRGLSAIRESWDRFFFDSADPRPLGILRIAVGSLLVWSLGWLGTDLGGFLGSEGWINQAVLQASRVDHLEWSAWDWVSDGALRPAWLGAMTILLLFTLGLFSRVTAPLAWVIAVATMRRNPLILFGFDQMIALWTFYLAACGASGQAFSLDRWIAQRKYGPKPVEPSVSANLGIRMVQLNLAIIYGAAGLSKLRGVSWWDGSAIIKNLGNAEFRPFDMTGILAAPAGVYFLNFLTHLALWAEILYPVFIWKKAFRPFVLVAVALMHAGIALTLGLTEFSLAMLAANVVFLSWPRSESS